MTEYRKMYAMLCAALLQAEELYIDTTLGEAETEEI